MHVIDFNTKKIRTLLFVSIIQVIGVFATFALVVISRWKNNINLSICSYFFNFIINLIFMIFCFTLLHYLNNIWYGIDSLIDWIRSIRKIAIWLIVSGLYLTLFSFISFLLAIFKKITITTYGFWLYIFGLVFWLINYICLVSDYFKLNRIYELSKEIYLNELHNAILEEELNENNQPVNKNGKHIKNDSINRNNDLNNIPPMNNIPISNNELQQDHTIDDSLIKDRIDELDKMIEKNKSTYWY